jgi:hypothetical protein
MPTYLLGNGDNAFESAFVPDWTNDSRVFGGNGDDDIAARALSPTITSRLLVRGGNGDDSIFLDASNSVALGGNGDDVLTSIGGLDNTLRGGNGDDLLISFGGGSGMGQGNVLRGGNGEDTFRFTNPGNLVATKDAGDDRAVSAGDVFLGPMDVITDYRRGELIELRNFGGPDEVPPYTRVEEAALIVDPLSADRFRPVVGDGQYALFQGSFEGEGVFTVDPKGYDLLVVYDAFDGDDNNIAQGSLALLGITDPGAVLIG